MMKVTPVNESPQGCDPGGGPAGGLAPDTRGSRSGDAGDMCRLAPDVGPAVECGVSVFQPRPGAPSEINLTLAVNDALTLDAQLSRLSQAYDEALSRVGTDRSSAVFLRLFCSDPANQVEQLRASDLLRVDCAVSLVGQAPVGPGKVALWAYHVVDPARPLVKSREGLTFALRRDPLVHYWTTGLADPRGDDSYTQTEDLLGTYVGELGRRGLSLADHVIRTWLFVRDVDLNYDGLVSARRELFQAQGLTGDTHYIASSGIGGEGPDVRSLVTVDAWAVGGLLPEQVRYLKALDHLSPTNVYGVTFERGTAIRYRDRSHLIISGTASIDASGEILHCGDVDKQLDRTLENVEVLLAEGGARATDMSHWLVYLRDASDEPRIRAQMRARYGAAPMVFAHAPVCRPGWLLEIEGIAAIRDAAPDLPAF